MGHSKSDSKTQPNRLNPNSKPIKKSNPIQLRTLTNNGAHAKITNIDQKWPSMVGDILATDNFEIVALDQSCWITLWWFVSHSLQKIFINFIGIH